MDRRLTPATDRIAHRALMGLIEGRAFTAGTAMSVTLPLVDLLPAPGRPRDRQLLLGDAFIVIDRDQGYAFGFAQKDGYCGWLPEVALAEPTVPTHWVAVPASHLYEGPKVQARDIAALTLGARLTVTGITGRFAQTAQGFVPVQHLREIGQWLSDPVAVAEMFLGIPYLWGGNSHAGLDCSGLVQMARHACGLPCPGDSDLQQALGTALEDDTPLQRGDLLFWRGHVAMVTGADRLLHANGHSMTVAFEPTAGCIARIEDQGGGPVIHRARP